MDSSHPTWRFTKACKTVRLLKYAFFSWGCMRLRDFRTYSGVSFSISVGKSLTSFWFCNCLMDGIMVVWGTFSSLPVKYPIKEIVGLIHRHRISCVTFMERIWSSCLTVLVFGIFCLAVYSLSEPFNRLGSSVLATNVASMCASVWVTFEDALSCGMDGGELEREPTECQHHITEPLSAAAHAATALAQAL